ncbi:MAG: glycosyltransferase family 2 protein [Elusimicrobiaceae bacterium]|nr:glycosyltransferase family 2 protein [Elusimicrobiaceae bacterium]
MQHDNSANKTSFLAVLLATCNGEKYLPQLLDSVLEQLPADSFVLAHDDGSSDSTPGILDSYSARFPALRVLKDGIKTGGACRNFAHLLENVSADYFMLCDQDDVWLTGKIAAALTEMRRLEAEHGTATPLLVHTDLAVADKNLKPLAASFMAYQNLLPSTAEILPRLAAQNVVTGCTTLINRPLRDLAAPIPPQAQMHDWWLAMVACAFGHIGYDPTPLILYRQHGGNDTGAHKWSLAFVSRRMLSSRKNSIERACRQAGEFVRRYEKLLAPQTRGWLETYAELGSLGFIQKRIFLFKNGIRKNGPLRTIGFFLSV